MRRIVFARLVRHSFILSMKHPVGQRLKECSELQTEHADKGSHHISELQKRNCSRDKENHGSPDQISPTHVFIRIIRLHIQRTVNRAVHMGSKPDRCSCSNPQPRRKFLGKSCDQNRKHFHHCCRYDNSCTQLEEGIIDLSFHPFSSSSGVAVLPAAPASMCSAHPP